MWRVPKLTSVSIVCCSCAALTGAMIARSFASGEAIALWGGGAAPSNVTHIKTAIFTHPTLPLLVLVQLAFAAPRV